MLSTPGTHRPTWRMSLRKNHTFSTGAFTSNATVPSGIARASQSAPNRFRHRWRTTKSVRSESTDTVHQKRERAEDLPRDASAYGVAREDSAFSQERKACALVNADLAVLGHFVHRFAVFMFPITEYVYIHFRSFHQFTFTLVT